MTTGFGNFGHHVAVKDGSILPARCAICNKAVTEPPRRFVLRWDPHGRLTQHLGLIGLIISHFTARRGTFFVHFCPWHAKRRLLVLSLSAAVTAASVGVCLWEDARHVPAEGFLYFIFGALFGGIIFVFAVFNNLYFRALQINGDTMAVKGFGKKFRAHLKPEEILLVPELSSAIEKSGK